MQKPLSTVKPKILFYDLETAGVQGLSADRGFIVCFGYKWAGEKEGKCITIKDFPGKDIPGSYKGSKHHNDGPLLAAALEIMSQADLTVAHYGDKFDRPYVESRLMKNHLPPLPVTRQVDTCYISQKKLKLSSNRLGNLADFLEVDTGKMDKRGGWPNWWMGALVGDPVSIAKMAVYCIQDVQCLEECFERIKPIVPSGFLINMAMGGVTAVPHCCASCGGKIERRGFYYSALHKYQRYVCLVCGKWGRDGKALDKE